MRLNAHTATFALLALTLAACSGMPLVASPGAPAGKSVPTGARPAGTATPVASPQPGPQTSASAGAPATVAPGPATAAAAGFSVRIVFEARSDTGVDIFSMNPNGTDMRRLTRGPGLNGEPACSPDGRRIAFTSWRDRDHHLYVMNADGSSEILLTNDPGNQWSPAWSPDGQRIVYVSEAANALYVMDASGSGKARLPITGPNLSAPAWSPDGQHLAYTSGEGGSSEIHVTNLDGSGNTNLTRAAGVDHQPAWAPDGKQIAFWATRTGNALEIYVENADGSALRRLTDTPGGVSGRNNYRPAWSPDGKQIAFYSDRDGNGIWNMNADGSGQVRLTDRQLDATNPCWLPDAGSPLAAAPPRTATPAAPTSPAPPPLALPTALVEPLRKTYTSNNFMVSFEYPADWKPIQGYDEKYGGRDGFFQASAGRTGDLTLANACDLEAHHRLQPYGSQPKVVPQQIQGQPACLILPSADQSVEMERQAALEVVYPQPVTIGGTRYNHFILYADQDHIQQMAQGLRFLAVR